MDHSDTLNGFCAQVKIGNIVQPVFSIPVWFQQFVDRPHQEVKFPSVDGMSGVWFGKYTRLTNARLYLYCRDRCYCNATVGIKQERQGDRVTGVRIRTSKPRGYPEEDAVLTELPGWYSDELTLDVRHHPEDIRYSLGSSPAKYYTAFTWGETTRHANLKSENLIRCENSSFPDFPFPPPYDEEPPSSQRSRANGFETVQQLCAVALSGGNPGANAGGYCHRSGDARSKTRVAFLDDMTPRVEWTFGGNTRFSFQLRYFCARHCWCASGTQGDREIDPTWGVAGFVLAKGVNGGLVLKRDAAKESGEQTNKDLYPIAPGAWDGDQPKTCVVDEVDYCKIEPWPTHILGPKPRMTPPNYEPPGSKDHGPGRNSPLRPPSSRSKIAMCGQQCSGPARSSCAGYEDSPTGCRCVLPSYDMAHMMGIDPIAPTALCIDTDSLVGQLNDILNGPTKSGLRLGASKLFGKRDEQRMFQWLCPCNSTYASQGCCDSESGLVWESED
ncbi:MAG: hypothetical protein M1814_000385 [Vezdaea aestivalis]|nr:MAG: hypothetical protein M1814_000385 [Vezdaea aestivalis]